MRDHIKNKKHTYSYIYNGEKEGRKEIRAKRKLSSWEV